MFNVLRWFWGVSTWVNCVINKVPPVVPPVDFTSQVSQLKPLYHWWDLRFFTPPESMGKRSAGSFWQIAFTISTWWKNRQKTERCTSVQWRVRAKYGLLGDLNPYDISVKLELLCKTVLKKLDRNESHAHKFGCKYQNGSREYHVCSKMSFETPPFVPCHSPNNSIFVLLPNARFLVNLWRIPKFRWILLINKNPASQPISQKITSQFTSIYNINLWCVFKSKPRSVSHATFPGTNIPVFQLTFEDDFPFPQVGCVSSQVGCVSSQVGCVSSL